jgi:putative endonuclease
VTFGALRAAALPVILTQEGSVREQARPSHNLRDSEMRSYYVCIMMNRSGMPYTGFSNNLERRTAEHRAGVRGFTSRYRLVKLVYYEVTDDVWAAIRREKEIKGLTRAKKMALVRSQNPAMKDLAPELFGWRGTQFCVTSRSTGMRRPSETDPSCVRMTGSRQDDGPGERETWARACRRLRAATRRAASPWRGHL